MDNGNDGRFIKGLFCGVALTLVCMAACLGWAKWKLEYRTVSDVTESEDEAVASGLELNQREIYRKTKEIEYLINESYTGEIDTEKVSDSMYRGLLNGLGDPYSVYYSAKDMAKTMESTEGVYSGIGLTLSKDAKTQKITVISCFENTPASEAGILPGDVITGLNGNSIDDMSLNELVSIIREGENDSFELTLERDGQELKVTVSRAIVEITTVSEEMLEDNIGYLQILEFDSVTVEQFRESMKSLEEQGMEKLIIDVRNNPGGVLQVVTEILDDLLPEGLIVYTEDKQGNRTEYYSDEEHKFEKPLVVLINGNSASAAEIFAGAVKDYELGTLVGTTTFGKGIVQRIYDLADGTGIKLTVANYYTPKGNFIHQKGIEPDVTVQPESDGEIQDPESVSREKDNQFQKALEIIKNK